MAGISPILQNKITPTATQANAQTPNNRHEKIYLELQKRAHEVKPNEAKAVIVKEGMLGNPITDVKDTVVDAGNFFKTVKTGQMSDNNIGRINDLGLGLGSLVIASYLAAHSKTKTESIMRFVGGGMFLAAMQLWPKLFINIPARLVHGFRIDRKYISAQGDKKDFFLDNQFLVWDAVSEEQLRKDAKNAGIDYDSENGKEKIQRKMQKTALQNRTLWMATAGFATPLITALTCNFVEPHIQKAVVKHDVKKTKEIFDNGLETYMKNLRPQVENASSITELFKGMDTENLGDDFFKKLSSLLDPYSFAEQFKDMDDARALKNQRPYGLVEQLMKAQEQLAVLDEDSLKEKLKDIPYTRKEKLGDVRAAKIIEALKGDFSKANVEKVLSQQEFGFEVPEGICSQILTDTKQNNKKFFEFVEKLNEGPIAQMRARAKAYVDLLNPVAGSKAESATTLEFETTMKKIFKALGFSTDDMKRLRKNNSMDNVDFVREFIQKGAKGTTDAEYRAFVRRISTPVMDDDTLGLILKLEDSKNIASVFPEFKMDGFDSVDLKGFKDALAGGNADENHGLIRILRTYIDTKHIDIDTIKTKAVICANFERRLANGEFAKESKNYLTDAELKIAKKMIYEGTASTAKNAGYAWDTAVGKKVAGIIFDSEKFTLEKQALQGTNLGGIVDNLKNIFTNPTGTIKSATKDYMACGSFVQNLGKYATRMGNNKAWMKIFGSMAAILVGVTLLAQPFFGKIDKEFPEDKNGGAK